MIFWILNTPSNVTERNSKFETKNTASSSELEERLLLWTRQCQDYKLSIITGETIQAKAAKIRYDLVRSGDSKDTVKLQELMFFHGWVFQIPEASRSDVEALAWRGGICDSE
uniref:AlNc14C399G11354 protein n=1 Tax=Albugo laibachii Nc14 TaxID=890382 RepID=F0WYU4_9STRA|nr:AlNc14C399G11354 [Albugo laibachii Nc14]|eukprot:CCA26653.1 AlNc14C399G11354 [Albugo laibachii Nc14]